MTEAADPYFPLGRPPFEDVEGAAELLLKYQDAGLTGPEFGSMFARLVLDVDAVIDRADELRAERGGSSDPGQNDASS